MNYINHTQSGGTIITNTGASKRKTVVGAKELKRAPLSGQGRRTYFMKAIRISEIGGPEVMHLEEIETPTPQEGQILIKVAAAGVNYADIAQRQGTYLTRTRPPMTLG